MNISRRWFIGGAASLGAMQGCRVMESAFGLGGTPRLRFGVVSDIHVIAENVDAGRQGNTRVFRNALKWFDRRGVDAVMIAGDMADAGLFSQLQCVADAWFSVFPNNRSLLDGRPVEKVFIYGNHDWEGQYYDYTIFGRPSLKLSADQMRRIGMKKSWEEIFQEEYTPFYRKTIKGYDFFGSHWDGSAGVNWAGNPRVKDHFAKLEGKLDPHLPFFYCQHPHLKDTVYGADAWGHDDGSSTQALSAFPNAVAFSGHSHYSLVDERSIWQGAFTSIGTGSLRYSSLYASEVNSTGGYENYGREGGTKEHSIEDRLLPAMPPEDLRDGLLVSVYDDRLEIERRDFERNLPLASTWILPLPAAESRPFAFAEHARRTPVSAFPKGATVRIEKEEGKVLPRAHQEWKPGESDADKAAQRVKTWQLVFPAALETETCRAWRYDIEAVDQTNKQLVLRRYLSPSAISPLGTAEKEILFFVAHKSIPKGTLFRFKVTPVNCFGQKGEPIYSSELMS